MSWKGLLANWLLATGQKRKRVQRVPTRKLLGSNARQIGARVHRLSVYSALQYGHFAHPVVSIGR